MAVTAITDLFVPQVVGDLATNILFKKVPLLRSGVVANAEKRILSRGGNKVTFPMWVTSLTGMVQANPGATRTGVTPAKVAMDTYEETVASKIISIDFDKNALEDVAPEADLNGHVAEVVATQSAINIQDALVLKAEETDLEYSALGASTKTLTVDGIAEAKFQRGEYADDGMPILFVHTDQCVDILQSSDFKSLSTAATTALVKAGVFVPPGTIGIVHNCWVVPMDSVRHQKSLPAISSITRSSSTATVTTASAHGLRVGDYITISGATETEYNGTFKIATVPTDATFTYAVTGTPDTPATGTPVFTANYPGLMIWPEALGLYIKKEVTPTVKDVHAGTTVITVDWDFRYASTLFRNRPRGSVRVWTR
jgi:hypothetical protein